MSLSNSRLSYLDCFDLLERATEAPRGIRVEVPSHARGTHLRMRIHQARQIDRFENSRTYPSDHPLHGRSPYDIFTCRVASSDGRHWVYIDRVKAEIGAIESIPEDHQIEPPKPTLRIEYKPEIAPSVPNQAYTGPQIRRR